MAVDKKKDQKLMDDDPPWLDEAANKARIGSVVSPYSGKRIGILDELVPWHECDEYEREKWRERARAVLAFAAQQPSLKVTKSNRQLYQQFLADVGFADDPDASAWAIAHEEAFLRLIACAAHQPREMLPPIERDQKMVDSYLGAFFNHARKASPNSATAVNGRTAALMLVAAAREEGRQEPRPITEAMVEATAQSLSGKSDPDSLDLFDARMALEAAEKARTELG